ncbi:MAG: uroporphyrinogen decarboxylase family protein [Saccharofermentanales bacterium]
MTSREKIYKILDQKSTGSTTGFWTGNPHPDTIPKYLEKTGCKDLDELYDFFGDDCRWYMPDIYYKHPEGQFAFDTVSLGLERKAAAGYFADCESVKEVDEFSWPDPKYLDFTELHEKIKQHKDKAIFTGMWSPFFHVAADFFGMENYFIKMHTDPEVVEAVTEHIVDYYLAANEKLFTLIGDDADTMFFGNDFGTQRDLILSPELFKKFILPSFKRIIAVGKKYNKKIMLHSCGSIGRVIPMIIDAGVDAIHPIQALAYKMDAATLAREYKNDLAFMGGVDTQDLLLNATPRQIREEVIRLKELLSPNFIVSPSHECILPNVPFENVLAMAYEAKRDSGGFRDC